MLAAQPQTSYAAVMHRKRVLGDKSVDDAARAAAYSRGNRIKLSQVTTAAHFAPRAPTYSAYSHPLPLQVLRQFPSAHDGRKIRCAMPPTASAAPIVTRDLTPSAPRFSAVEKCVTEIDALPERCRCRFDQLHDPPSPLIFSTARALVAADSLLTQPPHLPAEASKSCSSATT
jgi:hypothetical protein